MIVAQDERTSITFDMQMHTRQVFLDTGLIEDLVIDCVSDCLCIERRNEDVLGGLVTTERIDVVDSNFDHDRVSMLNCHSTMLILSPRQLSVKPLKTKQLPTHPRIFPHKLRGFAP